MTTKIAYRKERLDVDVYPDFVAPEAQNLFDYIEKRVPWTKQITPTSRVNQNYGDPGLKYILKFGGYDRRSGISNAYSGKPVKTIERAVLPWDDLPALDVIKEMLLETTGSTYNYCVIQRYPSGRVGINPHKDKEMLPGSLIAGISLGATRTLTLIPPRYNKVDRDPIAIQLPPGSLYLLKDPTNRHWQHSIDKDETKEPRISLTFRTM